MPPRKRYLGRATRGWDEEQIRHLRLGHDFLGGGFGDSYGQRRAGRPFDAELAKQAWDELGERLTAEHIADQPGSRPWGWWYWEAPEPRRVVTGEPSPDDGYYPWSDRSQPPQLFFGKPVTVHAPGTVCYETELDCLDRLNLLTPDERHSLTVANITNPENNDDDR